MKGKFHLATVRPTIDILGNVAYNANDVLFDWYAFQIPKGGVHLKTVHIVHPGTNGVSVAGLDIDLMFATSFNGGAPPTIGNPDSAPTGILGTACKNHIMGRHYLDADKLENLDAELVSHNTWSYSGRIGNDLNEPNLVLNGDPTFSGDSKHSATVEGYQTIWIAGFAIGTTDFGTGVTLNQGGTQAISTTAVDLVTSGTDPRLVFAIGDEVISFVATDGSSPKKIGTVTAIADNVSLEVDAVEEAFDDATEICHRRPLIFHFGFEY